MLDYIVQDFLKSRIQHGDNTIGGMVVCDSADQAKKMFEIFQSKYNFSQKNTEMPSNDSYVLKAASPKLRLEEKAPKNSLKASLILHDVGSKDDRKQEVEDFKAGKIDILFVYNMLLTGFDAKRLKKLYLGRVIKDHNLLQTLTRVNRPYKKFRYGFDLPSK